MNALTLDLTAQYIDLRIGNIFEFYLSTKVLVVLLMVAVVLRTRKVIVDRLAQRNAQFPPAPPQIDLLNSNNPFDDFA
jgi:hypothetical protein